ncbi:MAG TPA: hypothetical protein DCZ69_08650 [Syntrophobacteraceae bacterium]|nr:hypothetical protein [Syntrophobacteraceae bacterium]
MLFAKIKLCLLSREVGTAMELPAIVRIQMVSAFAGSGSVLGRGCPGLVLPKLVRSEDHLEGLDLRGILRSCKIPRGPR